MGFWDPLCVRFEVDSTAVYPNCSSRCSKFFYSTPHQDITALWHGANTIEFILTILKVREEEVIFLKSQTFCDRARKWHGTYRVPVQAITREQIHWRSECEIWSLTWLPVNSLYSFDRMYLSSGFLLTSPEMILTVLTSASVLVVYELSPCKADIGNMMGESGSGNAYFLHWQKWTSRWSSADVRVHVWNKVRGGALWGLNLLLSEISRKAESTERILPSSLGFGSKCAVSVNQFNLYSDWPCDWLDTTNMPFC